MLISSSGSFTFFKKLSREYKSLASLQTVIAYVKRMCTYTCIMFFKCCTYTKIADKLMKKLIKELIVGY